MYPGDGILCFHTWVSLGLTVGSGCSLTAVRWWVFSSSWVPRGSPAHHPWWLKLLMTVTSFVYWYGRKCSISPKIPNEHVYVDLVKEWTIGKNLLLAEWGEVSWSKEQMNTRSQILMNDLNKYIRGSLFQNLPSKGPTTILQCITWRSHLTQGQRFCLPLQQTQVQSLIQEDPTCHGATKPMCLNYWACALELQLLNPHAATPETHAPHSLCSATRGSTKIRSLHAATRE